VQILAVCGSLQRNSGNLTLLRQAQALAPEGVDVLLFDGLRELPHFNPDLETNGEQPAVAEWRRALQASAAVLIASPEYGHSLPGALKNGIDWVIGSGELERKLVAITCAVPALARGRLGLRALADTLGAVSAQIIGAEPIPRGPNFEREVGALLLALVDAARRQVETQ
jgi:chromate reductase, NAD(P)H dehydrogenase (quinone)